MMPSTDASLRCISKTHLLGSCRNFHWLISDRVHEIDVNGVFLYFLHATFDNTVVTVDWMISHELLFLPKA